MKPDEFLILETESLLATVAPSSGGVSSLCHENPEEMPHNHVAAAAVSITSKETERIWRDVRTVATELAQCESILYRCLQDMVLERNTPADILAAILARRLSCADMSEAELFALMSHVFKDDEFIQSQATADIAAVMTRDPACLSYLHVLLNLKGFQALQVHRISHRLWCQGRKELAYALSNLASLIFGVDIHPAARIGSGVMLDHGVGIVIGETAVIDDNVSILQNVTLGGTGKEHGDRHPKVRSGVMIGAGAKILGNIEIGTMSRVAAGSVVLKEVPPYSTVAGVPAKVVRRNNGKNFPALEMRQKI